jgi:hypothetical protein
MQFPFLVSFEKLLELPLFRFRPVYKAFRDDSSFNFMVFFFILFFHAIFCLVQALGLSTYAVGWLNTINTFGVHPFIGIIMLVSAVTFTLAFAGMAVGLLKVHKLYRGAGFSIDKARKEFSDGVMSDRNVQAAANQAARAAGLLITFNSNVHLNFSDHRREQRCKSVLAGPLLIYSETSLNYSNFDDRFSYSLQTV